MTEKEQTDHFADELDRLVDRFRSEYDLSYAVVVGVLQMKAWLLCSETSEREDEV
jgi:hypothetical protein